MIQYVCNRCRKVSTEPFEERRLFGQTNGLSYIMVTVSGRAKIDLCWECMKEEYDAFIKEQSKPFM